MTTMDTAIAAARSLDPAVQARIGEVRALDAWLDSGAATGTAAAASTAEASEAAASTAGAG